MTVDSAFARKSTDVIDTYGSADPFELRRIESDSFGAEHLRKDQPANPVANG
jgi:hypothetical protein